MRGFELEREFIWEICERLLVANFNSGCTFGEHLHLLSEALWRTRERAQGAGQPAIAAASLIARHVFRPELKLLTFRTINS
jgi:hypothetical protein